METSQLPDRQEELRDMKIVFAVTAGALLLTGCSHQPMTPQQQAIIMQMMQNNQAAVAQANQNAAILGAAARQNAPVNCITSYSSGAAYTTCQ
jgi:PBP1b-binding outer membrane lipoprotein LpoB